MNREVFDLLPDIVKGVGKNISRISNKMCRRICQRFCLSARLFGTPGWSQWWSTRDILMAILFWWKVEGWSNTCVGSNSRKTSGSIPCTFNRTNYCDESQQHGNDDQPRVSGVFIWRFSETVEVLRETRQLPSENDQCLLFLRQSLWKMMLMTTWEVEERWLHEQPPPCRRQQTSEKPKRQSLQCSHDRDNGDENEDGDHTPKHTNLHDHSVKDKYKYKHDDISELTHPYEAGDPFPLGRLQKVTRLQLNLHLALLCFSTFPNSHLSSIGENNNNPRHLVWKQLLNHL